MITGQDHTTKLNQKHCRPCENLDTLSADLLSRYKAQLHEEWYVIDDTKLTRTFKSNNFQESMNFANKIAELAEQEDHHPDLHIHYKKVVVDLTTHAIKGLSENDFILAAKIDELSPTQKD